MTAPLVAAPALLPGESVLHYVNARWTRTRHTHRSHSAHRTPHTHEAAGTLFLTDYRLLWVPQARHRSHHHHHSSGSGSSSSAGASGACCVCLCEDAAYAAERNGVVSVPYTTSEDVAFTAEDGTDVLAQDTQQQQQQWRGPVRMKIETKCFVHAEFHFAAPPAAPSEEEGTATAPAGYEAWRVAARLVQGLAVAGAQQPERAFAPRFRAHAACVAPDAQARAWRVFDAAAEWARLALPRADWRVSALNARHHVCEGYPAALVVPAHVDDAALARCAALHVAGRFPVVVWRSPTTGAVLARASALLLPEQQEKQGKTTFQQGKTSVPADGVTTATATTSGVTATTTTGGGTTGATATATGATGGGEKEKDGLSVEQEIVKCIRTAASRSSAAYVSVMDARARTPSAAAGRHERAHVICLSLADTHVLRESKHRLRRLILAQSAGNRARAPDVAAGLGATGWLQHVRQLLAAAQRAAVSLAAGTSVLAVCGTGCDQSAQLAALAQLLADGHYRTLRGFALLVEKEWVAFGHRFALRHGLGRLEDSACAPLFLQFLDCVHQVRAQHPAAFEFNDAFLVDLATEAYAGRTGTFLANSALQRALRDLPARTASFWALADAARTHYVSPDYVPPENSSVASASASAPLTVRCDAAGITLWREFYLRHSPVVADNVAFDRPLLPREPAAVTRALAASDSPDGSTAAACATGTSGGSASAPVRRRSISSSAGAARAVAVEAFVAENDAGAREIARGQEVFLLEKVSDAVWFISTDARRTFMAHVPAHLLRECGPSALAARRQRAVSRLVPPSAAAAAAAAASTAASTAAPGAAPGATTADALARTRSSAGAPPRPVALALHARRESLPADRWQCATSTTRPGSPPLHERFLLLRQQQQQQQQKQEQQEEKKEKKALHSLCIGEAREPSSSSSSAPASAVSTPTESWAALKRQYMASRRRLRPLTERSPAHRVPPLPRAAPPWVTAALRTLAVHTPPSKLVSSLLSPRAALLPPVPVPECTETPRVVLPHRPSALQLTPTAATAGTAVPKTQTRFQRSRTAFTIAPVRTTDLGSSIGASSVLSPTTVITRRTEPAQHSHLQLLRRAAALAQRPRAGAGPVIGTSRVRGVAPASTPPTPRPSVGTTAHQHQHHRSSEHDSSSATSSDSGDDVSLSDLSTSDDEDDDDDDYDARAGRRCSPWFGTPLRTPSPSPSPSPAVLSPTEPKPLDLAGLKSSSKRFLLSLFRAPSKRRLDAPGSPTSPTSDVTPVTPTVHPPATPPPAAPPSK